MLLNPMPDSKATVNKYMIPRSNLLTNKVEVFLLQIAEFQEIWIVKSRQDHDTA
jgi:hypothetical protein